MGNCIVSVHVTGAHHNGRKEDIDHLAAKFADDLKANGHNVTGATIVAGGEHDLMSMSSRFPLRDEKPEFYDHSLANKT